MKKFSVQLLLILATTGLLPVRLVAQTKFDKKIDSLNMLLTKSKPDTNRCRQLAQLADLYAQYDYTLKCKPIAEESIALGKKLNYIKSQIIGYKVLGKYYDYKSEFVTALKNYKMAYLLAKQVNDKKNQEAIQDQSNLNMPLMALPKFDKPEGNLVILKQQKIKLVRAQTLEDAPRVINTYMQIAIIYETVNDFDEAAKQYGYALAVSRKNELESTTGIILVAIGDTYLSQKKYAQAEKATLEALAIENKLHQLPIAYNNLIAAYRHQQNYSKALYYAKLANNAQLPPYIKGTIAINMGNLYIDAPDSILVAAGIKPDQRYVEALKTLDSGLGILKQLGNQSLLQQFYLAKSIAYSKMKDYEKAYENHVKYLDVTEKTNSDDNERYFLRKDAEMVYNKQKDSLNYLQQLSGDKLRQQKQALLLNQQQLQLADKDNKVTQANLQAEQNKLKTNQQQLKITQKEQALANTTVQLQKTEIKAKKTQSYYLIGGIAALLGLSFFIAQNYNNQRKSNKLISAEKQRSDDLLLNILPADVAEELKQTGSSDARLFDEVTVLFTDFVNFTHLSELLTPKELVSELHYCFKAFDDIMATHNIEKIKTIGDAYLAVAGLPNADANHAANTIKAAQEIQQFIHDRKAELGDKTFDIRIGIHSGSVVAGIVGVKKFAYDIWGDTVNTAARMEQNSEPGKTNVSEKTYELVKDQFAFTYRGEIEAKNKGALKMYFVT